MRRATLHGGLALARLGEAGDGAQRRVVEAIDKLKIGNTHCIAGTHMVDLISPPQITVLTMT